MGGLICVMFSGFLKHQSMGFGTMNLSWLFVLEFVMYMLLFKGILGWEKIINKFDFFLCTSFHIHYIFMIFYITSLCFLFVNYEINLDNV